MDIISIIFYFHSSLKKREKEIVSAIEGINSSVKGIRVSNTFPEKFYPNASKIKKGVSKYSSSLHSWKAKEFNNYNGLIVVPNQSTNLEGNYLWYVRGSIQNFTMIASSFLHSELLCNRIGFPHYLFVLLSAYFSRHFVNIEDSHSISKDCLNDFCRDQTELLNSLRNPDYICNDCKNNISDNNLYQITKNILNYFGTTKQAPKTETKKFVHKSDIKKKKDLLQESFKVSKWPGKNFIIEVYMSKKSSNLSSLYKEIDNLLKNTDSKIDGYSLYFVEGGWRQKIDDLDGDEIEDFNSLVELSDKYKNKSTLLYPFKDIIRPIKKVNNDIFAVYEESSIVLRFVVNVKDGKNIKTEIDEALNNIKDIFAEIGETENSLLFTVQETYLSGEFMRRKQRINNT